MFPHQKKHKDDVQKDFEKVEGQVEYCLMFIATGETKLFQS
jgi:hypothetical protein